MVDFIKVVPERLTEEAQSVRTYRANHDDIISRLNNLVLILSESWDGEAQAAFVSKYQGMQTEFRQFSEILESFAGEMEQFAAAMQEADKSLAAKIKSLA